jgi:hypothetical protein
MIEFPAVLHIIGTLFLGLRPSRCGHAEILSSAPDELAILRVTQHCRQTQYAGSSTPLSREQ